MPNGDPDFDYAAQEAWFAPLADVIVGFAREHNLMLKRYYHDSPCWSLNFNHPAGGQATIQIGNGGEVAMIGTLWWLDDFERTTRSIHQRDTRSVAPDAETVAEVLAAEFAGVLATPIGSWTRSYSDYREWKRFSKAEFEAMAPRYPDPLVD